jgi:DNA-directed RNA polymerase subunit RPC12/RpoP
MNNWEIVNDAYDFVVVACPHCLKSNSPNKNTLMFQGVDELSVSYPIICPKCNGKFVIKVKSVKAYKAIVG